MAATTWTWTDDLGHRIELDQPPTRIVGYAQAAATLASHGVPVAGWFGSQHAAESGSGASGPGQLAASRFLGAGSEFDLDAVHALAPDLIVSVSYGGELYGVPAPVADRLAELAPAVRIRVGAGRSLTGLIARFAELAGTIVGDAGTGGAGSGGTALTDAATARLAGAGHGRVLALSGGTPDEAYLANPDFWADLGHLAAAGVTMCPPVPSPGGGWAVVGWDALARYNADILLYDRRANSLPAEERNRIAAWAALPAVAAGRVLPWEPEPVYTDTAAAQFVDTVRLALADLPT
ncbi:ABC transporter substrate-binding protein [Actinocatenispora comari]|uniref:ABC transporter substrate-binding protein n=1 Tax=Actinocatenispora comari TaxID=2807577 RepID=A0A8J4EIM2_9ACTN|nr:ABC transporter substrate-binding protein [Actinocatenispora comari]GIL25401.1 hypothetical protein NUM_06560 [Actinocatenispora comari]